MAQKILIVEDEADIRELLSYNLKAEGFEVSEAGTGGEALHFIQEAPPHLLLLDLMLPDVSGLDICRNIRRDSALAGIPIIMLTAKSSEVDRIVGLELGADDYVVKPFSVREVVLRVKAVLSRLGVRENSGEGVFRRGALTIDPARHAVTVNGHPCSLTATEFKLLHWLASRPGIVHVRDSLLDAVWGESAFVTPRTVDTHIRRLREKLGDSGQMIETLRGVGYRFSEK